MREQGPVKGYIVLVNDDTGEATFHIVEPLHANDKFYKILNSEYGKMNVQMMADVTFPNILYGQASTALAEAEVDLGTGNGTNTTFNASAGGAIVPKYVVIKVAGAQVAVDDGDGNINGTGVTGTVDYSTGDISVTFTTAPANGAAVKAEVVKVQ